MSPHFFYPPNNGSVPGTITANQGSPNNDANAWPVRITDGTHDATVTAGGALNVAIASGLSNPLPVTDAAAEASLSSIDTKLTSQATAAKQDTGNTSLASIDSKLTNPLPVSGPLTDAELRATPVPVQDSAAEASLASIDSKLTNPLPVSGPLTDAELRASPVDVNIASGLSNPLPVQDSAAEASLSSIDAKVATETTLGNTLTAVTEFSAKTAGALVPEAFDYVALSYTGSNLTTATYKTGGAGGSTVATLTLAYTGAQLDSVTKT